MNQILSTSLKKSKKHFYKLQFSISIFAILILLLYGCFHHITLLENEKISNKLINNYNIAKLYNNYYPKNNRQESNLFGIIEIPTINLYYPIFSNLTEELLKIAPCKFSGESPSQPGNLCIAGHNYNNNLFFSNLANLNCKDIVYLYDNSGKQYTYIIFSIYEVNFDDLSPISHNNKIEKILTLVTCNNINNKRIIVKAKQKDF